MGEGSHSGFRLTAAVDPRDQLMAFKIRYDCYIAQGFIDPNPSGLFSDSYDHKENCPTWLLYRGPKPIGSIRTCVYLGKRDWNQIPSQETFADVLTDHFHPQTRLVELSRISVVGDPANRKAILALCSCAPCVGDHFDCEYVVAAFREEHFSFYEHLKFEKLCAPRTYPGVKFPTILAVLNWRRDRDYLTRHPLFHRCFDFPWEMRGVFDCCPTIS